MAQEVFQRTQVNFGGAITAETGLLVPSGGLTGLLAQNLNIQYAQAVNRFYELGTAGQRTNVYYVGGRAQGNFSVGHVVGPGPSMRLFYSRFSDVCMAGGNDLTIDLKPNICGTGPSAGAGGFGIAGAVANALQAGINPQITGYTAKFCTLTSLALSVAAADFVVQTQCNIMFSGLEA